MMTGPSGPIGHNLYAPPPPRPPPRAMPDPEADLSVKEVAALLRVDETTVLRWCQTGYLPARRVGGRWRIKVAALKERNPELWEECVEALERDADQALPVLQDLRRLHNLQDLRG